MAISAGQSRCTTAPPLPAFPAPTLEAVTSYYCVIACPAIFRRRGPLMNPVPSVLALALVFSAALTISLRAATRPSGPWQSPSGDSFPNKSVVIYVADFDIDVVPGKDARNSPAANVPRGTADGS